jgi:antitoxin component YwqK of YwqJK toxin-antitoxin module
MIWLNEILLNVFQQIDHYQDIIFLSRVNKRANRISKLFGFTEIRNEKGETYEALKGTDKKHGLYQTRMFDGELYSQGTYVNGLLHGDYFVYFYSTDKESKKVRMHTRFFMGKKNGVETIYNIKGDVVVKSNYKDGFLEGEKVGYSENIPGLVLCITSYSRDALHGVCRWFDNLGSLYKVIHYSNGYKHGPSLLYEKGKLINKTVYFYDESFPLQ